MQKNVGVESKYKAYKVNYPSLRPTGLEARA